LSRSKRAFPEINVLIPFYAARLASRRAARLSINPENLDNGKEDSYERLDPQVCFCEIPLMASPFRGLHAYTVLSGRAAKNLL
jgi:hypothetical protein